MAPLSWSPHVAPRCKIQVLVPVVRIMNKTLTENNMMIGFVTYQIWWHFASNAKVTGFKYLIFSLKSSLLQWSQIKAAEDSESYLIYTNKGDLSPTGKSRKWEFFFFVFFCECISCCVVDCLSVFFIQSTGVYSFFHSSSVCLCVCDIFML